jgi:hypothetical protein
MAYIEENMRLRRGPEQQAADTGDGTGATPAASAGAGTSASASAGAQPTGRNANAQAQADLFDSLDPRYKVERKLGEEGSVTNSLSMLTAIPEVDLGMECVSSRLSLPSFRKSSHLTSHLVL